MKLAPPRVLLSSTECQAISAALAWLVLLDESDHQETKTSMPLAYKVFLQAHHEDGAGVGPFDLLFSPGRRGHAQTKLPSEAGYDSETLRAAKGAVHLVRSKAQLMHIHPGDYVAVDQDVADSAGEKAGSPQAAYAKLVQSKQEQGRRILDTCAQATSVLATALAVLQVRSSGTPHNYVQSGLDVLQAMEEHRATPQTERDSNAS